MKTLRKLILFFVFNLIGFITPALIYGASLKFNLIDIDAEDFDVQGFFSAVVEETPVPVIISQPLITWLICALFSFAIFFVARKWRRIFLLAPIILPTLHSFVLLLKFM